jgi:hypothetical protein
MLQEQIGRGSEITRMAIGKLSDYNSESLSKGFRQTPFWHRMSLGYVSATKSLTNVRGKACHTKQGVNFALMRPGKPISPTEHCDEFITKRRTNWTEQEASKTVAWNRIKCQNSSMTFRQRDASFTNAGLISCAQVMIDFPLRLKPVVQRTIRRASTR